METLEYDTTAGFSLASVWLGPAGRASLLRFSIALLPASKEAAGKWGSVITYCRVADGICI